MKARFTVTVKYDIWQEVENAGELIEPREAIQDGAEMIADRLTEDNAVMSYEVIDNRMYGVTE